MSDKPNSSSEELSFTDRTMWEYGLYIPHTLNAKVQDALRAMAVKAEMADLKDLERIKVEFPVNGHRKPVYHIKITGHYGYASGPFMSITRQMREYADAHFPGMIKFEEDKESVVIDARSKKLRPLMDMLLEGFIKRNNPEFAIDFVKLMEAAAPKDLNYIPGSKDWRTPAEIAALNLEKNTDYQTNDDLYGIKAIAAGFGIP